MSGVAPLRQVEDSNDWYFYHSMDIPGYGEVRGEWATCGAIRIFPVTGPEGPALFSLRPEAIRHRLNAPVGVPMMLFKGIIRNRLYAGATDLLEVDCAGQLLRVRVPAGLNIREGEQQFAFLPEDVVRLE